MKAEMTMTMQQHWQCNNTGSLKKVPTMTPNGLEEKHRKNCIKLVKKQMFMLRIRLSVLWSCLGWNKEHKQVLQDVSAENDTKIKWLQEAMEKQEVECLAREHELH